MAKWHQTKRWRRLRLVVLEAAGYACARCGCYAIHVHHRIPVAAGGPKYPLPSGLEALCRECHVNEHLTPEQRRREARRRGWDRILREVDR